MATLEAGGTVRLFQVSSEALARELDAWRTMYGSAEAPRRGNGITYTDSEGNSGGVTPTRGSVSLRRRAGRQESAGGRSRGSTADGCPLLLPPL